MDLISQYTSNAMGLGVFGLVSFMITATFLVDKVYNVLNQIFRTQPRAGKFRRFTSFLTFLIIGVVLLAVVIALNSSIMGFLQVKLTGDGIETSFSSEAVKTIMPPPRLNLPSFRAGRLGMTHRRTAIVRNNCLIMVIFSLKLFE